MQHADEGPTGNRGQGTRKNIYTRALACTLLALQLTHRPPASRPAPRPASYALISTRQSATAFNQPLSFDTSKVTAMSSIFLVRPALDPQSGPRLHVTCAATTTRSLASRPTSRIIVSPPFDWAGNWVVRREQAPHPLRLVGQYSFGG